MNEDKYYWFTSITLRIISTLVMVIGWLFTAFGVLASIMSISSADLVLLGWIGLASTGLFFVVLGGIAKVFLQIELNTRS